MTPPIQRPARTGSGRQARPRSVQANVQEAKTHLAALLTRAHRGEEVIITKAGRPFARLIPIPARIDRHAGAFRGQIAGDVLGPVGSHATASRKRIEEIESLKGSVEVDIDTARSRRRPPRAPVPR